MPSSINLDNGNELFNIFLDAQGNLNFNASGANGSGNTRLSINDDTGTLLIGGRGQTGADASGAIQLRASDNVFTVFIGTDNISRNAVALLGGGVNGFNGIVRLGNSQGATTIDMEGSVGTIRCVSLTETSDVRLKKGIAPILNALDKVLAMRGVRYQRKQEDSPENAFSEESQIGFIGQEMESACPEIVSTDAEGYKSVTYTRLTPILVEAIKEQQQFLQRQAVALEDALQKIARIETIMHVGV